MISASSPGSRRVGTMLEVLLSKFPELSPSASKCVVQQLQYRASKLVGGSAAAPAGSDQVCASSGQQLHGGDAKGRLEADAMSPNVGNDNGLSLMLEAACCIFIANVLQTPKAGPARLTATAIVARTGLRWEEFLGELPAIVDSVEPLLRGNNSMPDGAPALNRRLGVSELQLQRVYGCVLRQKLQSLLPEIFYKPWSDAHGAAGRAAWLLFLTAKQRLYGSGADVVASFNLLLAVVDLLAAHAPPEMLRPELLITPRPVDDYNCTGASSHASQATDHPPESARRTAAATAAAHTGRAGADARHQWASSAGNACVRAADGVNSQCSELSTVACVSSTGSAGQAGSRGPPMAADMSDPQVQQQQVQQRYSEQGCQRNEGSLPLRKRKHMRSEPGEGSSSGVVKPTAQQQGPLPDRLSALASTYKIDAAELRLVCASLRAFVEGLLLRSLSPVAEGETADVASATPGLAAHHGASSGASTCSLLTPAVAAAAAAEPAVAPAQRSAPAAAAAAHAVTAAVVPDDDAPIHGLVVAGEVSPSAISVLSETYARDLAACRGQLDERELWLPPPPPKAANSASPPGRMARLTLDSPKRRMARLTLDSPKRHSSADEPRCVLLTPLASANPGQAVPSLLARAVSATNWLRGVIASESDKPDSVLLSYFASCGGGGEHVARWVAQRAESAAAAVFGVASTAAMLPSSSSSSFIRRVPVANKRSEGLKLYYRLLRRMLAAESQRSGPAGLAQLCPSSRFHDALLATAFDLVGTAYRMASLHFPAVPELLSLPVFEFYKMSEQLLAQEGEGLPQELRRHVFHCQERVLESLAWAPGSTVHDLIRQAAAAEGVNSNADAATTTAAAAATPTTAAKAATTTTAAKAGATPAVAATPQAGEWGQQTGQAVGQGPPRQQQQQRKCKRKGGAGGDGCDGGEEGRCYNSHTLTNEGEGNGALGIGGSEEEGTADVATCAADVASHAADVVIHGAESGGGWQASHVSSNDGAPSRANSSKALSSPGSGGGAGLSLLATFCCSPSSLPRSATSAFSPFKRAACAEAAAAAGTHIAATQAAAAAAGTHTAATQAAAAAHTAATGDGGGGCSPCSTLPSRPCPALLPFPLGITRLQPLPRLTRAAGTAAVDAAAAALAPPAAAVTNPGQPVTPRQQQQQRSAVASAPLPAAAMPAHQQQQQQQGGQQQRQGQGELSAGAAPRVEPRVAARLLADVRLRLLQMAALRCRTLCERLDLYPKQPAQVLAATLTALGSLLESPAAMAALLAGRHLDQLLLCCLYGVCKVYCLDGITFGRLTQHYRHQPQARRALYKCVVLEHGPGLEPKRTGTIVDFYNRVFIARMTVTLLKIRDGELPVIDSLPGMGALQPAIPCFPPSSVTRAVGPFVSPSGGMGGVMNLWDQLSGAATATATASDGGAEPHTPRGTRTGSGGSGCTWAGPWPSAQARRGQQQRQQQNGGGAKKGLSSPPAPLLRSLAGASLSSPPPAPLKEGERRQQAAEACEWPRHRSQSSAPCEGWAATSGSCRLILDLLLGAGGSLPLTISPSRGRGRCSTAQGTAHRAL